MICPVLDPEIAQPRAEIKESREGGVGEPVGEEDRVPGKKEVLEDRSRSSLSLTSVGILTVEVKGV